MTSKSLNSSSKWNSNTTKLSTSCKLNATGPFLDFKRTNMHTGQPIEQSPILV